MYFMFSQEILSFILSYKLILLNFKFFISSFYIQSRPLTVGNTPLNKKVAKQSRHNLLKVSKHQTLVICLQIAKFSYQGQLRTS